MGIVTVWVYMDGVAITLYDKFDELAVLVDIIRENWEAEYSITVCSNHPDGQSEIEDREIQIDNYVDGGRVKFNPDMDHPRHWINLRTRIFDAIKRSCETALKDVDGYVMHLHADAWPLSEEKFTDLKTELQNRKKALAVRGLGFEWRTPNCHVGQVMDQFFLIDSEFAREERVFDVNPLSMLPHTSIHNMMLILFVGRVGLENIWWYSRMQEDLQWDESPIDLPFTGVRPGVVNKDWEFLHISTDEFPDDLGKSVQAYHLQKQGEWGGEHITQYIDEYYRDDVFETLSAYEKDLNERMRKLGFQPEHFGREFSKMEAKYEQGKNQLGRTLVKNYSNKLLKQPFYWLLSKLPRLRFDHLESPRGYRFHRDAEWPTSAAVDQYQAHVKREDFPEDMQHWYDGFYSENQKKQ